LCLVDTILLVTQIIIIHVNLLSDKTNVNNKLLKTSLSNTRIRQASRKPTSYRLDTNANLKILTLKLTVISKGRTVAQAVSHWLPTAASRIRARVWQVGFVVEKMALGQVFLRVLRFPLPIFILPNSPSSQSLEAGTIDHSVADVPSGPSLDSTAPPLCKLKINYNIKKTNMSYDEI
jgi:hypothetical protein